MRKFYLLFLTCLTLAFAGCTKHDLDDSRQDAVRQNAEKVFGETFAPDHDWCTTVSGRVTVTIGVPGCTTVRVAACIEREDEDGGTVRDIVVLNETDVSEGQTTVTLSYDAPKDVVCLYAIALAADGTHMVRFDGDTVTIGTATALTRATVGGWPVPDTTPSISSIYSSFAADFGWTSGELLYAPANCFAATVPMGGYDAAFTEVFRNMVFSYFKNGRKYQNLPLVKASGYYNEKVYPITTGNKPVIVSPVYKNDGGYEEIENSDLYYYYFRESDLGADPVAYIKSLPKYMAIPLGEVFAHGKAGDDRIEKNTSFALAYYGDGTPASGQEGTFVFPAGYKIGFMIRSKYTGKEGDKRGELYGDGRLNNKVNAKSPFSSSKLGADGPRMAWLTVNGRMLLCCESGTDQDFNDVIFEIEGGIEGLIVIPDPEYNVYTFCFEDTPLGDYDLNDVVIKAERLKETQVRYTVVACGANDEIYIRNINSGLISDVLEVHEMFNTDRLTFVNTVRGTSFTPVSATVTVDKSFSFLNSDTQPYIYDRTIDNTVRLARTGQDPHAIMIPYDFRWPLEKICVKNAYREFNSWGKNPITSTDWYTRPVAENVY